MNIIIIMIIFSCFDAAIQQRRLLKNILQPKVNFFYKIKLKIHAITNKLFLSLKSDKNITKSNNFQMLLTMHSYFNSLSETNYRIYEELKNLSGAIFSNIHKNNLDELLQDVVEEAMDILQNNVIKLIANRTNKSEFSNVFGLYNDTEYSQENFLEAWSELSGKTIDIMIDSIITEDMDSDAQKISNHIIKHNKTEDSLDNFDEIWSKLSEKTTDNITDPIISETKSLNATLSLPITGNDSQELNTWHSGTQVNMTRRIYRGRKTKIKNYPFVASLHLMSEFLCVGSIISTDMVLTAASCLQIAYKNKIYSNNPRTIFVRVGSDHTKRSGKLIPIIQVIFHPKYDSVTLKHNLVIVKMSKKLKHMRRRIEKIKYDRHSAVLSKSVKEITILGWGARDVKDKPKDLQRLTMSHLDIYSIKDCKEVYSKYYVTDTNFCAGFTYKGGGACMGDVGGPAVVAEELVGVVSFGPTVCGIPDAPTVFTKVGFYAQWIDEVLNKKSAKKKPNYKTITHMTPNKLIIPTTLSYTKHAKSFITRTVSHTNHVTYHTDGVIFSNVQKSKTITERALQNETEEIQVMKKLISEFILGNHTVIDYLTNMENNENEKEFSTEDISENNEKLFLEPQSSQPSDINQSGNSSVKYKFGNEFKSYKKLSKPKLKITGLLRKQSTVPHVTKITETTRHQLDYDGEPTKLATFVESNEFPEDDFSSVLDSQSLLSGDISSYYEIEIPIEDTPFRTNPPVEKELVTYNKQINFIDFFEGKLQTTAKRPKVTELITKTSTKEIGSLNIYHTEEPILIDNENLQTKYNERGLYNIYHKSESGPRHGQNLNLSDKNEPTIFYKTDNSDTIVHLVKDGNPNKTRNNSKYYDDYTTHDSRHTITDPAPMGKTMTISMEDFNYDYDQKQQRQNNRDNNMKNDDY